ncbi:MAG: TonB-dependent receptor, partial [Anaerolineales bacterium]|nr:TonB-dependent receptor [Anaerolineales bacterium]
MPDINYRRPYKQNNILLLIMAMLFCLSVLTASALPPDTAPGCSVEGSVKDTLGNLIPSVTVLLENNSQMTVTDGVGHFCFESAPEGPLTLLATYKGFAEKWVNDLQPGNGPVEIILEPARIRESITVTAATRTEKRLEDVPIRTEVIMPEIIEMSSAKTLADAVEFTPGIRVENSCQNCNFSSIRMLGLQGPYTQILFDGQPTMSSLAQVYGVEHIPAQMVDRVEIVKGGGSSIYGSGSVGGVINIISHTPSRNSIHLESSAEWVSGTPVQSFGAVADWISKSNNTFLTAYTQNNNTNPMDLNDDAITEISDRKLSTSGLRFGQNFFDQSAKLTIDFSYMWEDRRGGSNLDLPKDQAFLTEWVQSKRTAFGTTWFHSPNTDMDYRLSFSLANTDRDTYYGSNQDPNAYGNSDNPLWLIDGQVNNYLGPHILSWGGQFRSDSIKDTQPAYDRTTDETYHNIGAYIQDDWFFLDGFELVYGFRVDKHSALEDSIVSPRAALMWSPSPELRIRSSIATGFLAPQVFDEDLRITQVNGEGQIIRNSPDLKEESSKTYMLGMEWRPLLGPGNALLEANAFDTEIKDLFL